MGCGFTLSTSMADSFVGYHMLAASLRCKVNYRINRCLVLTKIISDFTCSSLKITQQTKEFDAIM